MKNAILILTLVLLGSRCTERRNSMEIQLQQFINQHVKVVEPLMKQVNLSYWKATISGKEEDYQHYADLSLKLRQVYSNRQEFEQLKKFKASGQIHEPLLRRQLTILYNSYLENQIDPELIKAMVQKSTAVESKFNTFRGKIGTKEVTNNQILQILRTEKNSQERKAAWEASKQIGPVVTPELLELVKLRNQAARSLGFDNFYVMSLTLAEQDEDELVTIFQQLEDLTNEPFRRLKAELDSVLAKRYGIQPEEMRPWHYEDPFFQEAPKIGQINLDRYFKNKDIVELARLYYRGIDLPAGDILERSDLFEKPGKDQHAYCTDIDRLGDVRILANIRHDEYWMSTMLHELGHAVYDKYIDRDLPFLLRTPAHTFVTEAVAMFFGRLSRNPDWLQQMLNLDNAERAKLAQEIKKDLQLQQLIFARWCQVMFHFERQLYENPDQDLNKLWWDLVEKYQYVTRPTNRHQPDWAAKIHICSAPVYYHNYMLGEMLASQFYYYILTKVLNLKPHESVSFANAPAIGHYFRYKVFAPGAKYIWRELIKQATGEPLTARYFVRQFVSQ